MDYTQNNVQIFRKFCLRQSDERTNSFPNFARVGAFHLRSAKVTLKYILHSRRKHCFPDSYFAVAKSVNTWLPPEEGSQKPKACKRMNVVFLFILYNKSISHISCFIVSVRRFVEGKICRIVLSSPY